MQSSPSRRRSELLKGVCAVSGGFLIHLCLGNFFTLGNLSPFIISYIKDRIDPDATFSMAIWINSLAYLGQGSLMVVGGIMERKIGTRLTSFIGCALFCGFIAISSLTIKISFIALALTYGLASCIGLGIAYISVLALGMRWFPERKGLVNGTIVAGYGLGALIFNPVQTAIVNPDNFHVNSSYGYFTEPEILDSVPPLFLYMSAIYGVIQLFAICLLIPAQVKAKVAVHLELTTFIQNVNETDETEVPLSDVIREERPTLIEISTRNMLRYREFYLLWFTFALHCQAIQFVNTYYKTFGERFIDNDHFLSTVGSVAAIFNCLGRIFWGQLQDRTSYKICMLMISGGLATFMLTFYLVEMGGKVMFTTWVLATFFLFSGMFSLMPTAISQAFGQKNAGSNFGLLFTAPALMAICGAFFIQTLLQYVDWIGTFCTLAGLNLLALLITLFMPKRMESVRERASLNENL